MHASRYWRPSPGRFPPVLVLGAIVALPVAAADVPPFGFSGLEIYKVDEGTTRLACADVDGDGRNDLVLVNNRRATLDFFFQKSEAEIAASSAKPVEYDNINEIASDARFRKDSFLTEKRVYDLLVEDLNGDKSPDLAYCGDPKELVVVLREGGTWSAARQRFPLPEAKPSSRGLATGDLNADGRTDLALLGTEKTFLFYQGADSKLAPPIELPNSEKGFTALEIADLTGDGREDLLVVGPGLKDPFSLRVQGAAGLGPEVGIEASSFRSYLVRDVLGDPLPEISVVQESTGRLVMFGVERARPESRSGMGKPRIFPLGPAGEISSGRTLYGDFDADQLCDVLEVLPRSAQVRLHRHVGKGELVVSPPFPTLAGVSSAAAGDLDGDGRLEVVVLSGEERAVGVTRWDGTRFPFPRSLPLEGKPIACGLADVDGSPGEELAVVTVTGRDEVSIAFFAAGDPLGALPVSIPVKGSKDPPQRLVVFDANQDGLADLLLFFPYDPPRIFLRSGASPPEPGSPPLFVDASAAKDFGRGLLQGTVNGSFGVGDIDGDGRAEFLLAKKNFARAFRVTAAGALEVVDQFNTRDEASAIVGVAVADPGGDGSRDVILLDKTGNRLWHLSRGDSGPFQVTDQTAIPGFAYQGLLARDLDGNGGPDLVIEGEDRFGVVYSGASDWRLRRLAQYESELEDAWLDQAAVGDLNSDGRPDVLVSELSAHLFEILVPRAGQELLERKSRFRIFEEAQDSDEDRRSRQPREFLIADVTHDGKADVAMLIHDRLIVYPQE